MRIAIIGQSIFASSVFDELIKRGHTIVGVFTVADSEDGRPDPLALTALSADVPVFKFKRWRIKGAIIPSVFASYKSVNAELNVLPYCTQFIPLDVINYPSKGSICYHPSLLPRHRGASSINWTLIEGDAEAGFTIFWPDDGLDTGPILLQRSVAVSINDTVESLYNNFLFPEGIKGIADAVDMIKSGTAPSVAQSEQGASYDPMLNKDELCRLPVGTLTGLKLHNFIRGMDKVPGAWIILQGEKVRLFGSSLVTSNSKPLTGTQITIEGSDKPGLINEKGLIIFGTDDVAVCVSRLQLVSSGKMIAASKWGSTEATTKIEFTNDENESIVTPIKEIWKSILRNDVDDDTDFFKSGAGSMDVTRLVEEVKDSCPNMDKLSNEDVYMNTTLSEFTQAVVLLSRSSDAESSIQIDLIRLTANKREISFPNQLFINGRFVDSSNGKTIFIIKKREFIKSFTILTILY